MFQNVVYTGSLYLHECPVQRFIPIYLLVSGAFWVFLLIVTLIQLVKAACQRKDSGDPDPGLSLMSTICCVASEALVGCFMAAWFIAGE